MNSKFIKYAEWTVAILLSLLVMFLLLVRVTHAGGLWRDECDSLELARMPALFRHRSQFKIHIVSDSFSNDRPSFHSLCSERATPACAVLVFWLVVWLVNCFLVQRPQSRRRAADRCRRWSDST